MHKIILGTVLGTLTFGVITLSGGTAQAQDPSLIGPPAEVQPGGSFLDPTPFLPTADDLARMARPGPSNVFLDFGDIFDRLR